MDENQLSEAKLAMNHLGSWFSQGYCCIAISVCLIMIDSSRASWCKRLVHDSIRLKYGLLQLSLTILCRLLERG